MTDSNGSNQSPPQPTPPPNIPGVEGVLPPGVGDDIDVLRWRRRIGYGLAFFAIGAIAYALWLTTKGIGSLGDPKQGAETFAYVKLGVHGVVFVAWVWFGYQLLRAAERMALPYWWLRQNVDAVRLLLGISDPWRAALRLGEKVIDLASRRGAAPDNPEP